MNARVAPRIVRGVHTIDLDVLPCRVRLVKNPRARRFTLRLDPADKGAVLTAPPRVPEREIRSFLVRHAGWLRNALAQQPAMIQVRSGAVLPVAGERVRLVARAGPRRPPELDGGTLVVQGAGAAGPRVAAWLKMRARDALAEAARRYADRVDKRIAGISLRDTRTRWGSCSSRGTLNFSWRLAMAPPEVLDYVAAHEVAHLVEMNHSPDYWSVLERLVPDWRDHRTWLRARGRELHTYRFTEEGPGPSDS